MLKITLLFPARTKQCHAAVAARQVYHVAGHIREIKTNNAPMINDGGVRDD
jgi:hypothetical protein